MSNKIELKRISELLEKQFFIPSYQRGYRWTRQQVEDLLNDICDFSTEQNKWYCLQPLVVKKKDDVWEVIDGQQRLTTIFLIIHYFNEMWIGKQKIKEPIIEYQTRKKSYDFLKEIEIEEEKGLAISIENRDKNIDFHYISLAYQAIHDWVKKKVNFDNNEFQSKFKEKTKVIWYETDQNQDGRDIFSRINIGKIPLTNSELIKALFLNSSNFKQENSIDEEKIRLKQLEIATEWDIIEADLHNDDFWLFINREDKNKDTRIEFIFEILLNKSDNDEDNYYIFREYYQKFYANTENIIFSEWKEIKRCYQTLKSWFQNRELYHKIGFLIISGSDIKEILCKSREVPKDKFVSYLNTEISNLFKGVKIEEIEYGNKHIKNLLLLHNIQTLLNNEKENSKFPFNRYKREKWDIEHIHAIATEMPKKSKHQDEWLRQTKEFIADSELQNRIDNYNGNDFEQLFKEILTYFSENKKHEDINDISNLVLLDASTNRSYKNAVFPTKRKTIIDKDKAGTFIPICTKNVFMKYYSDKIEQMTFWGEKDRDNYLNDIKIVLKHYL